MALHLIYSNKIEHLHSALNTLVGEMPLSDPFQAETIVCPSAAMARWVNVQFSIKQSIAAHYAYPLPARWVWDLASTLIDDVPNHDVLEQSQLAWLIYALLKDINSTANDADSFQALRNYLSNDSNDLKLWTLSQQLALTFDRYLNYRPELIAQWEQGEASDWQANLWRLIAQSGVLHRVKLMQQVITGIQHITADLLPQRVSFFAVSSLPPLFLHFLQNIATRTEVYFFMLSPTHHYWSDCLTLKQIARQRLNQPDLNAYFEQGHELLSAWGRQAKVFQDTLLNEIDDQHTQHHELYDEQFGDSILAQLQQSIFNLDVQAKTIDVDDSIRINQCHSTLRECEVLHDNLLHCLEQDDIAPEDILVMVPDIETYAPMIEAVFNNSAHVEHDGFIPWNLSDALNQSSDQLIEVFLHVIKLSNARFSVSDISYLLDCPELLKRFNIEPQDIEIIKEYISQSAVHWGMDEQHKQAFDLPAINLNTWAMAQQRFFTFYSVDDEDFYQNIAPLAGFSASRGEVLAQFFYLLDQVYRCSQRFKKARTLSDWQQQINLILSSLFVESDSAQLIRDAMDAWVQQDKQRQQLFSATSITVSPTVLLTGLTEQLQQSIQAKRYFSGGVTFCGLKPMRSVPFKVIAMLGLNEQDFPRKPQLLEFDVIAQHWQQGDLLVGDEDRYLFLETILCARQRLILSYTGKSIKDNTERPPSVVVTELMDFMDSYFLSSDSSVAAFSQQLFYRASMQAFSPNNYQGDTPSYNDYWYAMAQLLLQQKAEAEVTNKQKPLEAPEHKAVLAFSSLIRVLKEPLKSYYQQRLKVQFYADPRHEDDEIFDLDSLQQWSIKNSLIEHHIQHSEVSRQLKAQGTLPHGTQADAVLMQLDSEIQEQLHAIDNYLKLQPIKQTFKLTLNDATVLQGEVDNYYAGKGLLFVSPSEFSTKLMMPAWLSHLVLCASQCMQAEQNTLLLCKKDKKLLQVQWQYLAAEQAKDLLQDMIELYQQCLSQPLPVFTRSSFSYQQQLMSIKPELALEKAIKDWHGNDSQEASKGEKTRDYVRMAFHSVLETPETLFATAQFSQLAESFYAPALQYMQVQE